MEEGGGTWTVQICHILLIQGANGVETALPFVWSLKRELKRVTKTEQIRFWSKAGKEHIPTVYYFYSCSLATLSQAVTSVMNCVPSVLWDGNIRGVQSI